MIKAALAGISSVLIGLSLKKSNPQFAQIISIAGCVLLFLFGLDLVQNVFFQMKELTGYLYIDAEYLKLMVKLVGISYLTEFSTGICKDAGYQALSSQIEIFARLYIVCLSIPVLISIADMAALILHS